MKAEILKAQASTLEDWAATYSMNEAAGSGEMAFLLRRCAELARKIADGTAEDILPVSDNAVTEPKAG